MTTGAVRETDADMFIVRASTRDTDAVARVIYRALFDIAPCAWLFPDPGVREVRLPALLRVHVQHALEHGIVYTAADRTAAALWYIHRGGPRQPDPDYAARIVEAVGPDHADRVRAFEECAVKARPTEPHDHLFIAAVDPNKQRQGIGSKFLAACHSDLAQSGRPAYLEAPDEATRRLYRRLDYADANGTGIVLPGREATRLHPMLRPWIPLVDQRVTVRDEVKRWAGTNGRVTSLRPVATDRPLHVAIDGDDEVREFALAEIRPERPREPPPRR